MPTLIRRAVGADAPTLAELATEHADYERSSAHPDARALGAALDAAPVGLWAWLAEEGGYPVAYAAVTEDFSTWRAEAFLHLDCLFVRATHRSRGIGAALFRQVLAHARERGITTLEWQTPSWNAGAIRFYERLGGKHALKARFIQRC